MSDFAQDYAARGWEIFPLKPHAKTPITTHGVLDASTDRETIRKWWAKTPTANIGLATGASGIVVIDLDGAAAIEWWTKFELDHKLRYTTLVAITPGKIKNGKHTGKGRHVFFKAPSGIELSNTEGTIAKGVDTRAGNGYVVLSPSIHPDFPRGPRYAWVTADAPIADMPKAVIDLLTTKPPAARNITPPAQAATPTPADFAPYVARAFDGEIATLRAAREGQRNAQLNRSAYNLGQLIGAGILDRGAAERALTEAAQQIGLDQKEIVKTITSGISKGYAAPRDLSKITPPERRATRSVAEALPNEDATTAAGAPVAAALDKSKKPKTTRTKSATYIRDLISLGYSFRFNELTQDIEVNDRPLTDNIAAEIRTKMRDLGHGDMRAIEDAYVSHALNNAFHPVKEFLNGLKWDGRGHIEQLGTFLVDNHTPFPDGSRVARRLLRRWLIGAVGKVFDQIQTPMLVLEGRQNLGKSHFIAWLASPMRRYFVEGPIAPDDKDCKIRLMSRWLWEVSELGATTRRADVEALKSFVTLRDVTVRRPYGRRDIHGPAVCSLVGTLNDTGAGFLNDTTGSRRFLTLALTDLNWDYRQYVDVAQVWAEAVAAYRAGESPYLTPEERDKQNDINATFTTVDPVEDVIGKWFVIDPDQSKWITPSADLLLSLIHI